MLAEAEIVCKASHTELSFKLSRVTTDFTRNITFTLGPLVTPNIVADVPGLLVYLMDAPDKRIVQKYQADNFRVKPMLRGKIRIVNQYSEFLPGFHTNQFEAIADQQFIYPVRVKVKPDHPSIEAVPGVFELEAKLPSPQLPNFTTASRLENAFRLKIGRDTPIGRHSLRFEVLELNEETHFHPIEKFEFEVNIPAPQLSAAPPNPFNGPKPSLAFAKKSVFAALGSQSAPQLLKLSPAPSEQVLLQVRTTLPDQPDIVQIKPASFGISPETGEARFLVVPKIGAVSGNLHLHIPDPYYRTHIQILERRASLEVVYSEVEQEQLRLSVDQRPLHNVTFGPYSLARGARLASNFSKDLQVQSSLQLGVTHQVMVMFVFIKNISRLGADKLLLPKIKDISPLANGSLVDLGDHTAVYFGYPEYSADQQSHILDLDLTRREFLPFSDFKIVPMFRDCQGEVFLVDHYFRKVDNNNLKLMRLSFDVPSGVSQKQVLRLMEATTPLKGYLAESSGSQPTIPRVPKDDSDQSGNSEQKLAKPSRSTHSLVLLTDYSTERLQQLLANTILNKKHVAGFRHYLFVESSVVIPSNADWIRLRALEELNLDSVELEVHLEDLGDRFILYGLQLRLGELEDFRPFLDFTALLRIKKHQYNLYVDPNHPAIEQKDVNDGTSSLAVFGSDQLTAFAKFFDLNSSEEYVLEARPCLFFKGKSVCGTKLSKSPVAIPHSPHFVNSNYQTSAGVQALWALGLPIIVSLQCFL